MFDDVLSAFVAVVVALLVALPFGGALKRRPWLFYLMACAMVALHLWYRLSGHYVASLQVFIDVLNKGYLACAFLAIVMFVGVLDERSSLRRRLQPIRAELSIISFILIVSHAVIFLPTYLPHLSVLFSSRPSMSASIVIATMLVVVYLVLTLTSFHVFRTRMPYKVWKAVQRLSYLMVALLYAHIVLALGRSAFGGYHSPGALLALATYTVIVAVYGVLRARKALQDRSRQAVSTEAASR